MTLRETERGTDTSTGITDTVFSLLRMVVVVLLVLVLVLVLLQLVLLSPLVVVVLVVVVVGVVVIFQGFTECAGMTRYARARASRTLAGRPRHDSGPEPTAFVRNQAGTGAQA